MRKMQRGRWAEVKTTVGRQREHPVLLGVLLIVLASQIYISLFGSDFKISVAIVLLPVMKFLSPRFPALQTALASAPGVFFVRSLVQWFSDGTFAGCWEAHGPEMLFYAVYGALFCLYLRRFDLYPIRLLGAVLLAAIDVAANLAELLVRVGPAALRPGLLLQLAAVGTGRMLLAWALLWLLDFYGVQVLRREDTERYQKLLMMTAALKSEVAWMNRGPALIERTMNEAYRLYNSLRQKGEDPAAVESALNIAKDIHEVKKEYVLVMRGISEALETETEQDGMELGELVRILVQSTQRTARAMGKTVAVSSDCADDFRTNQHHYLMSIFRNLLTNAVEAAKAGQSAQIRLREWSEGENYCFQIADSCGGIPPQRLEQIFHPGFSTKINYATGEINRGLGLAIVRELVEEKLGGTLAVGTENGGAVFTIRLPKQRLEMRRAD